MTQRVKRGRRAPRTSWLILTMMLGAAACGGGEVDTNPGTSGQGGSSGKGGSGGSAGSAGSTAGKGGSSGTAGVGGSSGTAGNAGTAGTAGAAGVTAGGAGGTAGTAGNGGTGGTGGGTPSVVVEPLTGLTTTEAGSQATFTVRLGSAPSADVTLAITSGDPTEGTVGPATLTFTTANWNAPQTVTITGVDDSEADGNQTYAITLAPTQSTDAAYNGLDPADPSVVNVDNETAGVTVSAISGPITESGGTATFTVVLNSQPTGDVTIPLTSSDTGEGTVSPASLTFTSANWNAPQTVTVTGVDDSEADGSQTLTIALGAAVSTDVNYTGLDAADVTVTNTDNDTAGVTVSAAAALSTTEAGGTATFTVVLNSQPTADVVIPVASSDMGEGTVSPATLTFTTANWNAPQTVTVTGVDDVLADGNQPYTAQVGAVQSTDGNYAGLVVADVPVTNIDNDTAGVLVSAISGDTSEAGATATFTIVLTSQPTADVTIPLSSSKTSEGTVAPASVTFTTANWNAPQTVTVTGVDDQVADGNQPYSIITGAAVSTDAAYNNVNPPDVAVTNTDNDSAGITVSAISGPTTEAGGKATFTVVLNSQPTADVTIPLSSSKTSEGTVAPASVTFTTANWNQAQTVTVTGVDDQVADGNQPYTIVTGAAASTDAGYAGLNAPDVAVTNNDNDSAGVTVSAISGTTTEYGATATFTVVLTSQPTANVVIPLSSSKPGEGTVSPASLTFTAANWNQAQTVTVTGVDDAVFDGPMTYLIQLGSTVSSDARYSALDPADVTVVNLDNEGDAELISVDSNEMQSNADPGIEFTDVSKDGRYVAFYSCASNLVPNDTNGSCDIFVRDRQAGTTERVSVTSMGQQLSAESRTPGISDDGRYVTFVTAAVELTGSGKTRIFRRDRVNGVTELVSTNAMGTPLAAFRAGLSGDGQLVVFSSGDTSLEGGGSGKNKVYVKNVTSGAVELISTGPNGPSDGVADMGRISRDGKFVTFVTASSNLPTNSKDNLFRRDRLGMVTTLVSARSDGMPASVDYPEHDISGDGRYVVFNSSDPSVVASGSNTNRQIYVRDMTTGQTSLMSASAGGTAGNDLSVYPSISDDGTKVAFDSPASNLTPGALTTRNVFVKNRLTGAISVVTRAPFGAPSNNTSFLSTISGDGSLACFQSSATNLVLSDTNNVRDTFCARLP